jgi:hypothetical protein
MSLFAKLQILQEGMQLPEFIVFIAIYTINARINIFRPFLRISFFTAIG